MGKETAIVTWLIYPLALIFFFLPSLWNVRLKKNLVLLFSSTLEINLQTIKAVELELLYYFSISSLDLFQYVLLLTLFLFLIVII